ncbi:MAG: hypothetical protein D6705_09955 [Deltaproteobacteria bacterium]|nr:MAG: hypothetical protein D6705_09955 [Deltaproteobacteria bacterium]
MNVGLRRTIVVAAAAGAAWAAGSPGRAADANRPPTPALFPSAACMVTVDRSADPVFHVEYDVPFDDVDRSPDEVADGRTHQFFAFARQFRTPPPNWITWDDVMRAEAAPATDPTDVTDEDVLETSSAWPATEWLRITPDDARLPITKAQAAMGVDWDTTGVPAGTYVVAAYTFDPVLNLWSPRPGVVRVLDDADAPDAPPALALTSATPSGVVEAGEEVQVHGCVAAMEGSTVRLAAAYLAGAAEPTWIEFDPQPAGPEGDAVFSFVVPEPPESSGQLVVRATVEDPMGRTYVAYLPGAVDVVGGGGGSTSGAADDDGGGEGCACHAGLPRGGWAGLVWCVLPWLARRRKRVPAPAAC